jgi:cell division septation protein DedD
MREFLDEEDGLEPRPRGKRDTELTLGFGTLLGIFFALVILCGLCFGLGYEVGRGSAAPSALLASGSLVKPQKTTKPASMNRADSPPPTEAPSGTHEAAQNGASPSAPLHQPTAQAARPATQPSHTSQQPHAQTYPANSFYMVRIAAVSNPEDGEVLVNALKRHGYLASARREGDGLIHVRIGPFGTRDDANHWRQKLLNDGYNAIVEQ